MMDKADFGPWIRHGTDRAIHFGILCGLASLICGTGHVLTSSLLAASQDEPGAADEAWAWFEKLAALERRHLLANYTALIRPGSRQ